MKKAATQVNLMPTRQPKDSIDIFVRAEDKFCQEQNCVDTTKSNSANFKLQNSQDTLPIISIFSGALGLDLGLEQAGFQVRVAVECKCHPTELRPLSVREYARLQQFPDSWEFFGSLSQQYIQIGNAVPVGLGNEVGLAIQKIIQSEQSEIIKKFGVYTSGDLIKRLINRPKTMLNPPRMRKVEDREAARQWMNGRNRNRVELLEYVSPY